MTFYVLFLEAVRGRTFRKPLMVQDPPLKSKQKIIPGTAEAQGIEAEENGHEGQSTGVGAPRHREGTERYVRICWDLNLASHHVGGIYECKAAEPVKMHEGIHPRLIPGAGLKKSCPKVMDFPSIHRNYTQKLSFSTIVLCNFMWARTMSQSLPLLLFPHPASASTP